MSQKPVPFNIGQALGEGLALQRQGRLREAEKIFARVLKIAPNTFDALNLLGAVKAQLGHMGEAHRLFAAAVKINPGVPQVWANLGGALHALKREREALDCFDKARALKPDDIDILGARANALLSLGRPREALEGFREVLARAPQHAEARLNAGIALAALGSLDDAVAEFDRALALAPAHPAAHFNRGIALYDLGRYAEAAAAHEAALRAAPDHAGAWLNRGRALAALNRYDEAIASYGKAMALRPDDADAHFMQSLALLTRGDYARGFEQYEWRWRRTGMPAQKKRSGRLWLGEFPLARKTVLVHAEQGLGDTIQFARYVSLLAKSAARVVLEVQPELTELMAGLDGAAAVIARGAAPPPFDLHCPLGSLPLALKTKLDTVPAPIPYLAADAAHLAKWSEKLGALPRPRIAVAWAGNPGHLNDRNRSLAFAQLGSLLALPNPPPLAGESPSIFPPPPAGEGRASFISIQRDVKSEDAAALAAERRLTHLGGDLESFADTAAVMALADLVITVDTAVAHLAGAMGRPLWVLLPFAPDWRWTLDRDTTPWYPTARLFRQPALGDWDSVIARVAAALQGFAGKG